MKLFISMIITINIFCNTFYKKLSKFLIIYVVRILKIILKMSFSLFFQNCIVKYFTLSIVLVKQLYKYRKPIWKNTFNSNIWLIKRQANQSVKLMNRSPYWYQKFNRLQNYVASELRHRFIVSVHKFVKIR